MKIYKKKDATIICELVYIIIYVMHIYNNKLIKVKNPKQLIDSNNLNGHSVKAQEFLIYLITRRLGYLFTYK